MKTSNLASASNPRYPGPPTAAGRANAAAALRSLAGKAGDLGVALCLEVVNRYETNLLNTAVQAAEFVDEVRGLCLECSQT